MSTNLQQVLNLVRKARRDYLEMQIGNDKLEALFDELLHELLCVVLIERNR